MQIRVSPGAAVLPANILRFYLYFSRPAESRFERRRLLLLDAQGSTLREPFLVLSQELWSGDGCRLTVLMEPGRIKRGLNDDPSHDPALVVGRTYGLVVTVSGTTARHDFRVGNPIVAPIDETIWRLLPPKAGSLDPVVVCFDRIMDAALCASDIAVLSPANQRLPAQILPIDGGAGARIIPSLPWTSGVHRLVVSNRFEDVCGNRLGEALDHDLGELGRPRGAVVEFTPNGGGRPRNRDP